MRRPERLQVGPYPPWDQEPLNAAFPVHRLFEADDRREFLRHHGPRIRAIATRGELGASRDAIGPAGTLINISRAPNVDELALLDALEPGRLGSATLDVFEGEPDLNHLFLSLENVLLQRHQASGTVETCKAMGQQLRDNLATHFAGRSLPTPVL